MSDADGKMDPFIIHTGRRVIDLRTRTHLMGIVNVTPDSFSDGGKYFSPERAMTRALTLVDEGADIIDIGGESSRPGSEPIAADEELSRVIPVIDGIRQQSDIPISIDTTKSIVAGEALKHGATIINDISALRFDDAMVDVASKYHVPVILMHMQGMPKTMQTNPTYHNVVGEIKLFFDERISFARSKGIDCLIIDPGIGFGKTLKHNLQLLHRLVEFHSLGYPLLVGTSRKSFIGQLTADAVGNRLGGSIASNILGIIAGAHVLRVHDVKQMKQAMTVTEAILHPESTGE